jgi:hypothetical protein
MMVKQALSLGGNPGHSSLIEVICSFLSSLFQILELNCKVVLKPS